MVLALAFLLTVVIEWAVLAWFSKLGFARTGWFCLSMNAVTWGAAMGVLTLWAVPVPVVELVIILAEAIILGWFWEWRPLRAFLGALLMNLASWQIGLPVVVFLGRRW
jgi:hypothetical protein